MALSIRDMQGQIQDNLNTRKDYDFGRHSWHSLYLLTTPKEFIKFPYTIKAFNNYLMVTDPDLVKPFNPKGNKLVNYSNVISGSFSWKGKPISIMVYKGDVIRSYSCHYWLKCPESVLWYDKYGNHGIDQVINVNELSNFNDIVFAIGGTGMKPGDAEKEGFTGAYSDVFRKTSHMLIGFDKFGYFNAVEVDHMNKTQMLSHMKKLGIEDYILLDGGHVTASNVDGHKNNVYTSQFYGISLEG